MRNRLALLIVLFAMPVSMLAAKRVTVEQLRQAVDAAHAAQRGDEAVVRQLGEMELSERLDTAQLQPMIAESPGPKTTQFLQALADSSAFLSPPAIEIPTAPAPDIPTQKAIMARVITYTARTLPTLPDFVATRETRHFDDSPVVLNEGEWPMRLGLHLKASYQSPIAYQNGRETDDPSMIAKVSAPGNKAPSRDSGLTSWGEFGPILGIVLVDAAKGKLGWARWEQVDGKPVAVFQFAIDRSVSHYNVQYCCTVRQEVVNSSYGGNTSPAGRRGAGEGATRGIADPNNLESMKEITGYHGNLTVDPQSGTVLRITIEADLHANLPIQRASILVDYGPVKIGETTYICPTRSISISASRETYQATPVAAIETVNKLQLNNVVFKDYHRFGSESKLMAASADDTLPGNAVPTTSTSAETALAPTAVAAAAEPAAAAVPVASPPPAVPTKAETEEEVLVDPLNGMPAGAGGSDFTIKVATRFVDLGLHAFDKHGKPITDLKQDEIEIYDNGRRQQLSAFHHAGGPVPAQSVSQPEQPSDTFTNVVQVATQKEEVPDTLILLMDESHLAFEDLNRARGEVLRFLKATRPTSRVALYSVSEHGFRVIQDITQDHSLVAQKLTSWMPNAQAVSQAQALDKRNRQQIDTVHNASDLNYVNGNMTEVPDYITSTDPELREMGDNPLRAAMNAMIALARHFSPVAGHKSMAWISGDSVLADWEDRAVGMEKGSKQLEAAMMHTREALNEAHISLYAVDASALGVGGAAVDPSLANASVELNPIASENAASAGGGGRSRAGSTGRMQSQMQDDLHGIQGPVRQLAEATGGRAINKGGDLKATLDGIDRDSTSLYEIGFNPDSQADGKFHTLQVKVPSRKDVVLRYRTGYLYSEEATASTQQRFQQAVWNPQDATGVALTAEAVTTKDSASGKGIVKLRIALNGLALKQETGPPAKWTDQLYIFVAERDDAAQKAEVSGDTLKLALKQTTYETGMPAGIPYHRNVDPKSKLGSIRIIVVDGNSGRMGSVTLPSSALRP